MNVFSVILARGDVEDRRDSSEVGVGRGDFSVLASSPVGATAAVAARDPPQLLPRYGSYVRQRGLTRPAELCAGCLLPANKLWV